MTARLPHLVRSPNGYEVRLHKNGPVAGFVEQGPDMRPWGWTVGLGWHTRLPTLGAALDALLADPAFGLDVHS